jgi:hypothetical protein
VRVQTLQTLADRDQLGAGLVFDQLRDALALKARHGLHQLRTAQPGLTGHRHEDEQVGDLAGCHGRQFMPG